MGSKRLGIPGAFATLALGAALVSGAAASAETSPAGRWKGAIELPGQTLEIAVQIAGDGTAWSGTIDIPAQNARNLPLSGFEISPTAVRFSIAGVPGDPTFRGTLSSGGGGVMAGRLTQGGQTFAFRLERSPSARMTTEKPVGGPETHERKDGTEPAHSLDEYVGDYANPAHGDITVSRDDANGLRASIQGWPVRLEHWHYETFRVFFEDPASADKTILLLFRTNVDGDVDALQIRIQPDKPEVVFEKKPKR